VGRVVDADGIPEAVRIFSLLAGGTVPEELDGAVGVDEPADLAIDIRAYFEEAAAELAGHTPPARSAESWFFRMTRAGSAVLRARKRLADAGYPRRTWWGMSPIGQESDREAERLWRQSRNNCGLQLLALPPTGEDSHAEELGSMAGSWPCGVILEKTEPGWRRWSPGGSHNRESAGLLADPTS